MSPQEQQADFENEVRRIARAKWPAARYSGASMLDGRERDGIFETEDSINFVEATVSGKQANAVRVTALRGPLLLVRNRPTVLSQRPCRTSRSAPNRRVTRSRCNAVRCLRIASSKA